MAHCCNEETGVESHLFYCRSRYERAEERCEVEGGEDVEAQTTKTIIL